MSLWNSLLTGDDNPAAKEARQKFATQVISQIVAGHPVATKYNLVILFDEGTLIRGDADRIYNAVRNFDKKKDILLVLYSSGGQIEPAYLISQLCRDSALRKFVAAVPRRAKSAATLICCGADEIHMGPMSELGPIDPQIGEYPALGLGNALRHIADLVSRYPASAIMFAEYLAKTVPPIDLGYYERVVESAVQYAEKLVAQHSGDSERDPHRIANRLVHEYSDHGFVIDRGEATSIFGEEVIKGSTDEYRLADALYNQLGLLKTFGRVHKFNFYWVGSLDAGCHFYPQKDDE